MKSDKNKNPPVINRFIPIAVGLAKAVSRESLTKNPTRAAGTLASKNPQKSRQ
jgi:hypothetical protein